MSEQAKKRSVMEIAAEINEKRKQQLLCMMELALWEKVKPQLQAQGLTEDDVQAFGFEPSFVDGKTLKKAEELARTMASGLARHLVGGLASKPEWAWVGPWLVRSGRPEWYNSVRLKDGRKVRLCPMLQAPHARSIPSPSGSPYRRES
jgi:hypothetical protein